MVKLAQLIFSGPRQDEGQHLHLPPAISGQNNYWLWGTHGCDPNVVIAVIGDTPEAVSQKYRSVEIVGRLDNPWAMLFEHLSASRTAAFGSFQLVRREILLLTLGRQGLGV